MNAEQTKTTDIDVEGTDVDPTSETGQDDITSTPPVGDDPPIITDEPTLDEGDLGEQVLQKAGLITDPSADPPAEGEKTPEQLITEKDAKIKDLEDRLSERGRDLERVNTRLDNLERGTVGVNGDTLIPQEKPPDMDDADWERFIQNQAINELKRENEARDYNNSRIMELVHGEEGLPYAVAQNIVKLQSSRDPKDWDAANKLYYDERKKQDEMRQLRDQQLTQRNQGSITTGADTGGGTSTSTEYESNPATIAEKLLDFSFEQQQAAIQKQAELLGLTDEAAGEFATSVLGHIARAA